MSSTKGVRGRMQGAETRSASLATVAHDLQQPLTVIRGRAELMLRQLERHEADGSDLAQRADRNLRAIIAAAGEACRQVAELLDAAHVELDRPLALEPKGFDLVALLGDVLAAWAGSTALHAFRFDVQLVTLPCFLDEGRLRRVFDNLLSNAVKYSPAGGVIEVRLRCETSRDADSVAVITVRDQGVGIPATALTRIFEPYYRAKNVATAFPGTGLGLPTARQTIEQHGGTIVAESREGAGTTITIRVPTTAVAAGGPRRSGGSVHAAPRHLHRVPSGA